MPKIQAFFFDQDGTIIDTEKDGHRVAFNLAFKEFGYDVEWDVDYYHELLQIAGGKERMKHHLHKAGFGVPIAPEDEDGIIKALHKRKTEIFLELIENHKLPLRTGMRRLMHEIKDAGRTIGICTTSNEKTAKAIAEKYLSEVSFDLILAGDIVSKKKPDPEIYLLALAKTGHAADECVVIEDSRNGVLAAKAAGMHVVAVSNGYTEQEDLSEADIIVNSLGEEGGFQGVMKKAREGMYFTGVLHACQLINCFS